MLEILGEDLTMHDVLQANVFHVLGLADVKSTLINHECSGD
jgi:hypothetical protein